MTLRPTAFDPVTEEQLNLLFPQTVKPQAIYVKHFSILKKAKKRKKKYVIDSDLQMTASKCVQSIRGHLHQAKSIQARKRRRRKKRKR